RSVHRDREDVAVLDQLEQLPALEIDSSAVERLAEHLLDDAAVATRVVADLRARDAVAPLHDDPEDLIRIRLCLRDESVRHDRVRRLLDVAAAGARSPDRSGEGERGNGCEGRRAAPALAPERARAGIASRLTPERAVSLLPHYSSLECFSFMTPCWCPS